MHGPFLSSPFPSVRISQLFVGPTIYQYVNADILALTDSLNKPPNQSRIVTSKRLLLKHPGQKI